MSNYAPPPSPPQYSGQQPPPQKSSGCWKWGLIGCAVIIVLGIGLIATVATIAFTAIKKSDIYNEAFNRAAADPRVVAALGEPIESAWWVIGSIHIDNGRGDGTITIPIHGPKGKGMVYGEASKEPGSSWRFSMLYVKPEHGSRIDLLASQ